jgi:transposase
MEKKNKQKDWREVRRLQALTLKAKGWQQKKIAEALGVTKGAVSQWFKKAAELGENSLLHRPPPGATSRLSKEQLAELVELLTKGAEAYGFSGQVWTTKRIAWLIQYYFGVKYHRAHISRLLRQLNWTLQKPTVQANQRDENKISQFQSERWDELKKSPK